MYGVSAIDGECLTDYEACARAAKPKNSISNLLGATKSTNGYVFHQLFDGFRLSGHHAGDHRRIDGPWANRVNANAHGGIFESSVLCKSKHPVLGGVIQTAPSNAHESADRRVVNDGATSLLAHLAQ